MSAAYCTSSAVHGAGASRAAESAAVTTPEAPGTSREAATGRSGPVARHHTSREAHHP